MNTDCKNLAIFV